MNYVNAITTLPVLQNIKIEYVIYRLWLLYFNVIRYRKNIIVILTTEILNGYINLVIIAYDKGKSKYK